MKIKSKENIGRTLLRGKIGGMCSALALLIAPHALAAVITIEASTDGYIRGSGTTSAGSFAISSMLLGATSTESMNSLMRFDLSSLPAGAVIDSVSLSLITIVQDTLSVNQSVNFELYQLLKPFSTGATWNTYTSSLAWEVKGGTGTTDRSATLLSTVSVNPALTLTGTTITLNSSAALIALIGSQQSASQPLDLWFGLSAADTDGARHILQLASSENTVAGPTLSITYTVIPEPTAISLGLVASGAILLIRRRQLAMSISRIRS